MSEYRIADRVKFHDARRAFTAGRAIVVSEYGHEPTRHVHTDTTTHTAQSTTWSALVEQVNTWRNRYPNQRYYIVRED